VDFIGYATGLAIFLSTSFVVVVCPHLVADISAGGTK
jgi:hypothetical protein